MTTAGLVLGLMVLLAGAVIIVVRRHERGGVVESTAPVPPTDTTDLEPASARPLGDDDVVLVPLPNNRNEVLVLGSEAALSVFDRSGITNGRDVSLPLPQLVRQVIAAGGTEATRRAQQGIDAGRIVALTPETVEQLKRGRPVYDKAGAMLGVVRGDKGRLKHVMRLDQKGAQAVVASNAATLALTAALSQQLASIEKQLQDISETLERFVRGFDRKRIANIAGINRSLTKVARRIQERGKITEADWQIVAPLSESVESNSLEAAAALDELTNKVRPDLDRGERQELLKELVDEESLAYWVSALAESDLALTRWDLLHLYWEQSQDPDSAHLLAERVRAAFEARQRNRHQIAELLEDLASPESRNRLDPVRQRARWRLKRQEKVVRALLDSHGEAFRPPEADPYAVEVPRLMPSSEASA